MANGQIKTSFDNLPCHCYTTSLLCLTHPSFTIPKSNPAIYIPYYNEIKCLCGFINFFAVNTFALHQVTWKIMVQMFMGILPSLMVLFDALPNALDVMLDI